MMLGKLRPIQIAVAGLIVLLIAECVARLITQNDWVLETTSELSSVRWQLLWLKTHTRPATTTDYKIDAYHPLLGWIPLKNAKNISMGTYMVNFNSDGVRGIKTYTKERQSAIVRIVVVGDSFTFGEDVNDDETYPAQLEKVLPNAEVLNYGVHGYGLDQMTVRLHLDGFTYHPDVVIYAFIGGDLDRTLLSFRDYMKPRYVLVGNHLQLVNVPIPPPTKLIRELQYHPAIFDLFALIKDRVTLSSNQIERAKPLTLAIWKQTVEDIQHHDAVPIFLYLPAGTEINNPDTTSDEQFMFSFCRDAKIACFSARPYLTRARLKGAKYNIHMHYEPETNRIIAQGLSNDLSTILPTRSVSSLTN